MKQQLVVSQDGSHTLYVPDLDEHYHSTFGAVEESRHIFIQYGFMSMKKSPLRILEVGFGTGLNTLMTVMASESEKINVSYSSIELFPLSDEIISKLNYPLILSVDPEIFNQIHKAPWGEPMHITSRFQLTKIHSDLRTFTTSDGFDLVYFDAFGPEVQPQLWESDIFSNLFSILEPGGRLVTYSAKGIVRRNLSHAGFIVEKHPGPTGKREITVAIKPLS